MQASAGRAVSLLPRLLMKPALREEGPFILLVFLFLALRLCTLLTSVEVVSWNEELYRGTIAKELIEGLKAPLWDYQVDTYRGGSLVVGALAVPLFLLLGPSLFALKMVPFLFSLATLALTYFFLKRFFDRRAALSACAILTLPPPVFTQLSLSAIGSHPESTLFTGAVLLFFFRFLHDRERRMSSLILFGLASGFGFWFAPILFIATATCLVSWFMLRRRSFLSRDLLFFSASFCAGVLPFIYYNATHRFSSVGDLRSVYSWAGSLHSLGEKLAFVLSRISQMALIELPSIFRFRSSFGIPDWALAFLYGVTAWSLLLPFLWREGREALRAPSQAGQAKLVPILLFPFVYVLLFSATNLPLPTYLIAYHPFADLRFFAPLYYILFLLLALALRSHRNPKLPLSILLSLGFLGQWSLMFHEPAGKALQYKGYSYLGLSDSLRRVHPFPDGLVDFQRLTNRYKEPERRLIYFDCARSLARKGNLADLQIILESPERVPRPYRHFFIENLGRLLGTFRADRFDENLAMGKAFPQEAQPYFYYGLSAKVFDSPSQPDQIAKACLRLHSVWYQDVPYKRFFYFDLGRMLYGVFSQNNWGQTTTGLSDSWGEEEKAWFYRGMGAEAAVVWVSCLSFDRPFDPLVAKLAPENQSEFFWGIGWGLWTEDMDVDQTRILNWISRLEEKHQGWALQGFEALEKWYGLSPG